MRPIKLTITFLCWIVSDYVGLMPMVKPWHTVFYEHTLSTLHSFHIQSNQINNGPDNIICTISITMSSIWLYSHARIHLNQTLFSVSVSSSSIFMTVLLLLPGTRALQYLLCSCVRTAKCALRMNWYKIMCLLFSSTWNVVVVIIFVISLSWTQNPSTYTHSFRSTTNLRTPAAIRPSLISASASGHRDEIYIYFFYESKEEKKCARRAAFVSGACGVCWQRKIRNETYVLHKHSNE